MQIYVLFFCESHFFFVPLQPQNERILIFRMRKILWKYTLIVALALLPIVAMMLYADSDLMFETSLFALEKVALPDSPEPQANLAQIDTIASDTIVPEEVFAVDTTRRRILLIGDSMVEGLRLRMADYALENGYDLMAVVWYSATTYWYAKSDTLNYFINQHQPDFIMMSLGGNEQFARDLTRRAGYVQEIVDRIGDIPFIWIGTPSWRSNATFNDCAREVVGDDRFYESAHLTLERQKDHAHPTIAAASIWMDSLAVWMSSPQTAHPIRMNVPTEQRKRVFTTIMLHPNCPGL